MTGQWIAGLATLVLLAGCANGVSVVPGFEDQPSRIGLGIADERPAADKQSEILSASVASCRYGIRRLGDETTMPQRLVLLRHDLEDALGVELQGATVHVTRYTMYWNPRLKILASWTLPESTGGQGLAGSGAKASMLDSMFLGQSCTKEEMGESWVDLRPDFLKSSPLITIVEASVNGKTYGFHSVSLTGERFRVIEPSQDVIAALRRANAELAAQIRGK